MTWEMFGGTVGLDSIGGSWKEVEIQGQTMIMIDLPDLSKMLPRTAPTPAKRKKLPEQIIRKKLRLEDDPSLSFRGDGEIYGEQHLVPYDTADFQEDSAD